MTPLRHTHKDVEWPLRYIGCCTPCTRHLNADVSFTVSGWQFCLPRTFNFLTGRRDSCLEACLSLGRMSIVAGSIACPPPNRQMTLKVIFEWVTKCQPGKPGAHEVHLGILLNALTQTPTPPLGHSMLYAKVLKAAPRLHHLSFNSLLLTTGSQPVFGNSTISAIAICLTTSTLR